LSKITPEIEQRIIEFVKERKQLHKIDSKSSMYPWVAVIIANEFGIHLDSEKIRKLCRRYREKNGLNEDFEIKYETNNIDVDTKQMVNDFQNSLPTADDYIKQEKEKLIAQNEKKIFSDLVHERAMKDIIADKMSSAIQILPEIKIKSLSLPCNKSYSEEEVVLQISDIQAGTYIDKKTTGGLNEYNKDILKEQFNKLLKAMVSIISRQKQIAPIKKLNIHCLGDMVEGIDIFIGQAQHVDQDLYNQMFVLADLMCWFFIELLYLFDEIEVSCIGGNHGRVGKKGENPHWVNWDVYLYKYIEIKLQNYKKIKFNIPLSWWYLDTIKGWNFLMLHGDDIKAFNGIPYYGIDRADAKWTQLLASKGLSYTYMELGHFHSASELSTVNGEKIMNGCWPGGSMFSLKSLMTSGRPRQNMFGVHPERGATWRYPIWLD
jgi:hypothetical protein